MHSSNTQPQYRSGNGFTERLSRDSARIPKSKGRQPYQLPSPNGSPEIASVSRPMFTVEESIVMRGVSAGKGDKQLCIELRMPLQSFQRLLRDLMAKTGTSDRTGLLVWASYLVTRWIVLAWLAVGLLMVVIGLGVSTVTVWTPFPAHRADAGTGPNDAGGGRPAHDDAFATPAEEALTGGPTDEMLNRALTDDVLLSQLVEEVVARARDAPSRAARRHRAQLAILIPASHGLAAITTMILAVLTAASAR